MNRIQKILMPNFSFGASEVKYQRGRQAVYMDGETLIQQGGVLSFDTYYNGLSTVVWKEKCGLKKLIFQAAGSGKLLARLLIVTEHNVEYELDRQLVVLQKVEAPLFELDLEKVSQRGILYVEFIAIDEAAIFNGGGMVYT